MKQLDKYPKLSAQIFNSPSNVDEFFLFNTITNRGFSIDGIAALLCKEFTGEKSLETIIKALESEKVLREGEYDKEIEALLADLEKNRLITFLDQAQNA